jgi:hypothetical protein
MPIPILGDLISELGKTARQIIPDPAAKRNFELQLQELADRAKVREHDEAMGQIETNKIEAGHASVFVSGWRPALGWVGAAGCVVAFVLVPGNAMIQAWVNNSPIPQYPIENLMAMLAYLLGASGIRSFDKLKGTAFSNMGDDPGLSRIKEVRAQSTPGLADKLPIGSDSEGEGETSDDNASDTPQQLRQQPRQLSWGAKVDDKFKAGVLWIEQQLGLNADLLMNCMAFETGQTFNPAERNRAGSSGTGLIQFMRSTALGLGTTVEDLAKMTAVQQLSYVYKYFRKFGADLSSWEQADVYMAILYPAAIGKSLDWQMPWKPGSLAYKQNKGLDLNKDQRITKAEAAAGVFRMAKLGLQHKG